VVLLLTGTSSVGFCSSKGLDVLAVVTMWQGSQYVEALGSGALDLWIDVRYIAQEG